MARRRAAREGLDEDHAAAAAWTCRLVAIGSIGIGGFALGLWPSEQFAGPRDGIGAVLAAHDMPAEGCGVAALDCRHHLQLVEADMAGVGLTPCRSMAAENIRDLQNRARHARRALGGWRGAFELRRDMLQRAHDLTDRLGGDPRIERGVLEFAALGSPGCRCSARADGWQSCAVRCAATRAYRSRPAEPRRGRRD